jgi:hypothetical protein
MTRMAGANPKIAAIFGGGGFGMNVGKMSQQAQKSQNADRMTAMGVDANAAKADIDAEYIKESAPYKAALQAAQQQGGGGGGGFGDILGSVAGIVGGLSGGGGSAPIGVSRTSSGMGIPGSVAPVTKLPYYGPSF